MADMINHPPHYTHGGEAYEHHLVVRAWGLNYWLGQSTKYICRCGHKDATLAGQVHDLEKARWFLTTEIEHLKSEIQRQALENSNKDPELGWVQPKAGDHRYRGAHRQLAVQSPDGITWISDPEIVKDTSWSSTRTQTTLAQPYPGPDGRVGPPTPRSELAAPIRGETWRHLTGVGGEVLVTSVMTGIVYYTRGDQAGASPVEFFLDNYERVASGAAEAPTQGR